MAEKLATLDGLTQAELMVILGGLSITASNLGAGQAQGGLDAMEEVDQKMGPVRSLYPRVKKLITPETMAKAQKDVMDAQIAAEARQVVKEAAAGAPPEPPAPPANRQQRRMARHK